MATKLQLAKLKINIKSLAAESKFNRLESKQFSGLQKADLNEHRRNTIRVESRITQWVYAYGRGVPRSTIENGSNAIAGYWQIVWVKRAKRKMGSLGINTNGFDEWING